MTVKELQEALKERNSSTTGRKADLQERLLGFLRNDSAAPFQEVKEEDPEADEDEESGVDGEEDLLLKNADGTVTWKGQEVSKLKVVELKSALRSLRIDHGGLRLKADLLDCLLKEVGETSREKNQENQAQLEQLESDAETVIEENQATFLAPKRARRTGPRKSKENDFQDTPHPVRTGTRRGARAAGLSVASGRSRSRIGPKRSKTRSPRRTGPRSKSRPRYSKETVEPVSSPECEKEQSVPPTPETMEVDQAEDDEKAREEHRVERILEQHLEKWTVPELEKSCHKLSLEVEDHHKQALIDLLESHFEKNLEKLKVDELRVYLELLKLHVTGRKAFLVARLKDYLHGTDLEEALEREEQRKAAEDLTRRLAEQEKAKEGERKRLEEEELMKEAAKQERIRLEEELKLLEQEDMERKRKEEEEKQRRKEEAEEHKREQQEEERRRQEQEARHRQQQEERRRKQLEEEERERNLLEQREELRRKHEAEALNRKQREMEEAEWCKKNLAMEEAERVQREKEMESLRENSEVDLTFGGASGTLLSAPYFDEDGEDALKTMEKLEQDIEREEEMKEKRHTRKRKDSEILKTPEEAVKTKEKAKEGEEEVDPMQEIMAVVQHLETKGPSLERLQEFDSLIGKLMEAETFNPEEREKLQETLKRRSLVKSSQKKKKQKVSSSGSKRRISDLDGKEEPTSASKKPRVEDGLFATPVADTRQHPRQSSVAFTDGPQWNESMLSSSKDRSTMIRASPFSGLKLHQNQGNRFGSRFSATNTGFFGMRERIHLQRSKNPIHPKFGSAVRSSQREFSGASRSFTPQAGRSAGGYTSTAQSIQKSIEKADAELLREGFGRPKFFEATPQRRRQENGHHQSKIPQKASPFIIPETPNIEETSSSNFRFSPVTNGSTLQNGSFASGNNESVLSAAGLTTEEIDREVPKFTFPSAS